ncbi:MAG: ankyrin repeat domain-containing protein [Candidatus Riflebacteria bacterium]|nr:ankyrin repeat domain-containing protein [Candidatus Riflebacteria bacterium]
MDESNVFEFYLNQISAKLKENNLNTALDLCREMRARLLASPVIDPMMLGWQRFYEFTCLIKLNQDKEALERFLSTEQQPFILDRNQTAYMTSVAAELACNSDNIALTIKLSRLAWALSFRDPDIISRVQKAQNACIYCERLRQSRLNFGFARFLTGFGKSNDIPVLFLQGLECLLANYRQSGSLTVSAILLNSLGELAGYLEALPDNLDRLRIVELVDAINNIPGTINVSGQFGKAVKLLEENRLTEITALIAQYPHLVNENDKDGMTLLFKAIQQKNLRAMELLIGKDADPHRCEAIQGSSPLLMAVNLGQADMVKILLESGSDPEIKGIFGQTPLIRSVTEGYFPVLALLLEFGSLLDRRDDSGNTALMHAIEDGQLEMVKALIFAGSDTSLKNQASMNLLQIAESSDKSDVAKFLKQHNIT